MVGSCATYWVRVSGVNAMKTAIEAFEVTCFLFFVVGLFITALHYSHEFFGLWGAMGVIFLFIMFWVWLDLKAAELAEDKK